VYIDASTVARSQLNDCIRGVLAKHGAADRPS